MLEHQQPISIGTANALVWSYVSDMANWAAIMPGFRDYEVVSDRDSRWTLKVGVGALVKTVHVLVQIDLEAIEYVERMTGRRLPSANSFWTIEARRLLSDFLWSERGVPPMRRLVLKSLDPDKLPVAARWNAGGIKR